MKRNIFCLVVIIFTLLQNTKTETMGEKIFRKIGEIFAFKIIITSIIVYKSLLEMLKYVLIINNDTATGLKKRVMKGIFIH